MTMEIKDLLFCSRSSRSSRVSTALQKAQAHPHRLLPLAAAQVGAGLREQPVRGGPGEEGARQVTALVRNPGKDERCYEASICILFVCS